MSAVAEALAWMDDYDRALKEFQQVAEAKGADSPEACTLWAKRNELKAQIVEVLATGIYELKQ
jgi:hypothetical protein